MNNDVDPYLAFFVLDAWGGWRGLVFSRHIRVRRWSCTSIKALSLDSHELVSELSMSTASFFVLAKPSRRCSYLRSTLQLGTLQVSSYTQSAPVGLPFERVVPRVA